VPYMHSALNILISCIVNNMKVLRARIGVHGESELFYQALDA